MARLTIQTNIKGKPVGLLIDDKNNCTNIRFQLSEPFAYLNSGVGQRDSDNRGWTV